MHLAFMGRWEELPLTVGGQGRSGGREPREERDTLLWGGTEGSTGAPEREERRGGGWGGRSGGRSGNARGREEEKEERRAERSRERERGADHRWGNGRGENEPETGRDAETRRDLEGKRNWIVFRFCITFFLRRGVVGDCYTKGVLCEFENLRGS